MEGEPRFQVEPKKFQVEPKKFEVEPKKFEVEGQSDSAESSSNKGADSERFRVRKKFEVEDRHETLQGQSEIIEDQVQPVSMPQLEAPDVREEREDSENQEGERMKIYAKVLEKEVEVEIVSAENVKEGDKVLMIDRDRRDKSRIKINDEHLLECFKKQVNVLHFNIDRPPYKIAIGKNDLVAIIKE